MAESDASANVSWIEAGVGVVAPEAAGIALMLRWSGNNDSAMTPEVRP